MVLAVWRTRTYPLMPHHISKLWIKMKIKIIQLSVYFAAIKDILNVRMDMKCAH